MNLVFLYEKLLIETLLNEKQLNNLTKQGQSSHINGTRKPFSLSFIV